MAESLKFTTLTASIAALTISITKPDGTTGNLAIRDISALTTTINQQDCPLLAPRPDDFVSDLRIVRDSYGGDSAYKTARYTLTYVFYFYPVSAGAGLFEKYGAMVTAAAVILNHLASHTNLTGATDVQPPETVRFGAMADAAGTLFHGCELSLAVEQHLES